VVLARPVGPVVQLPMLGDEQLLGGVLLGEFPAVDGEQVLLAPEYLICSPTPAAQLAST